MKPLIFTAKVEDGKVSNDEMLVESICTYCIMEASNVYYLEHWLYEILDTITEDEDLTTQSLIYLDPLDICAGLTTDLLESLIKNGEFSCVIISPKVENGIITSVEIYMGPANEYGKEDINHENF